MRSCTVRELVAAIPGLSTGIASATVFASISTDSRRAQSGALFWALQGENFDAHAFVSEAISQGAVAAVVEIGKTIAGVSEGQLIRVPSTLVALQQFAQFIRRQQQWKVLGVTGSNGKTSCKEFAARLIAGSSQVHWNEGSFNNHFGLPFNLLGAPAGTQVVVAEMGMNHAGEITELVKIAEPDVVACTMVGTAHIENFSSQSALATAKEEIYLAANPQAIRIYNIDNPWTQAMSARAPATAQRIMRVSEHDPKADIYLVATDRGVDGLFLQGHIDGVPGSVQVRLLGKHNGLNLAVAAAMARALEIAPQMIWQRLTEVRASWGRNQLVATANKGQILFDAYNANPESVAALMDTLERLLQSPEWQNRRLFGVFGQLRELGAHSAHAHEQWGDRAARLPFTKVLFFGANHADFQRGYRRDNVKNNLLVSDTYNESLARELLSVVGPQDLIAVKASRGEKLERFVQAAEPRQFAK